MHNYLLIIEILGLVTGISYVILMIKENRLSWPVGILAVILYAYSCYESKIYGEMSLQFIYVIISIYGWYNWTKNRTQNFTVSNMKFNDIAFAILVSILVSVVFYFPLNYFKSSIPVVDALTNGFAIVATYLAAKKKLENWIFWIPIDLTIAGMMLYKDMHFYFILYLCYTAFAIFGYIQWKKQLQ